MMRDLRFSGVLGVRGPQKMLQRRLEQIKAVAAVHNVSVAEDPYEMTRNNKAGHGAYYLFTEDYHDEFIQAKQEQEQAETQQKAYIEANPYPQDIYNALVSMTELTTEQEERLNTWSDGYPKASERWEELHNNLPIPIPVYTTKEIGKLLKKTKDISWLKGKSK